MADAEGMDEGTTRRVRAVVAERLGVDPEVLTGELSLRDELAADSLDLADVRVAIEDELGVVLPDRILAEVRTVADLVAATVTAARVRRERRPARIGGRMYARLAGASEDGAAIQERSDDLTPYAIETLVAAARAAGAGARLDVTVDAGASADAVAGLRAALDRLAARGLRVRLDVPGSSRGT